MTDTVWAAIVGGFAGIVTGSISSIIAPWVNWRIERKRRLTEDRKEAIHGWREMIMGYRFYAEHNKPSQLHLELERRWISLEPNLPASVIQRVTGYQERAISPEEREEFVTYMLVEVAKLERKWGLL